MLGLRNSTDPAVRAHHGCASMTASLSQTANQVWIQYSYTAADVRQYKRRWVRGELATWESLKAQGKAARSLKGTACKEGCMGFLWWLLTAWHHRLAHCAIAKNQKETQR